VNRQVYSQTFLFLNAPRRAESETYYMVKFADIIPFLSSVLSAESSSANPLHCDVVRNKVASLMGVDPTSLGLTQSKPQKPVWSMLCGHAFNDLKDKGLVQSKFKGQGGAEWWWVGSSVVATPIEQPQVEQPQVEQLQVEQPQVEQPQVEQPKVQQPQVEQPKVEQPKVEQPKVDSLDVLKARALADYPSFKGYYDFNDPTIKALAIKSSACFSTYSAKDSECLICPLASDCQAKKSANDKAKAETKAYKEQNKDLIESQKLKESYLKAIPTSADLKNPLFVDKVKKDCVCTITKQAILVGQSAYMVKGFGVVGVEVGKALGF